MYDEDELLLLTIDQVADILQVGRGRIYQMLNNNEIPAFRIGEVWKIPKKGIEKFILESSGLS